MPVILTWQAIAIRLILAVIAGSLIGVNRDEHGRPAGLRTTVLICLAAAVAMIQANLLMHSVGKSSDSFVVLDLMRLPLGILTGIGFIGAGAIIKRNDLVTGVTTAATIWLVTVIGLCFGGGQIGLGIAATILAIGVLWNLRWLEKQIPRDRHATLILDLDPQAPGEDEIRRLLGRAGCRVESWGVRYKSSDLPTRIESEIRWRSSRDNPKPPEILRELVGLPGILMLDWRP